MVLRESSPCGKFLSIDDGEVSFTIDNQGRASTQNATLQYVDGDKILGESKTSQQMQVVQFQFQVAGLTKRVGNGAYTIKRGLYTRHNG